MLRFIAYLTLAATWLAVGITLLLAGTLLVALIYYPCLTPTDHLLECRAVNQAIFEHVLLERLPQGALDMYLFVIPVLLVVVGGSALFVALQVLDLLFKRQRPGQVAVGVGFAVFFGLMLVFINGWINREARSRIDETRALLCADYLPDAVRANVPEASDQPGCLVVTVPLSEHDPILVSPAAGASAGTDEDVDSGADTGLDTDTNTGPQAGDPVLATAGHIFFDLIDPGYLDRARQIMILLGAWIGLWTLPLLTESTVPPARVARSMEQGERKLARDAQVCRLCGAVKPEGGCVLCEHLFMLEVLSGDSPRTYSSEDRIPLAIRVIPQDGVPVRDMVILVDAGRALDVSPQASGDSPVTPEWAMLPQSRRRGAAAVTFEGPHTVSQPSELRVILKPAPAVIRRQSRRTQPYPVVVTARGSEYSSSSATEELSVAIERLPRWYERLAGGVRGALVGLLKGARWIVAGMLRALAAGIGRAAGALIGTIRGERDQ
ncbi:MAG: hypothetical protein JXQ72_17485 [Anaerolineae bacterium]|nr:hypothetical protein [Anaerolineae bacterium]